jgi:hypothetical protein
MDKMSLQELLAYIDKKLDELQQNIRKLRDIA